MAKEDPALHIDFRDDPQDLPTQKASSIFASATLTSTTAGREYAEQVATDFERGRLHLGCRADVPLSREPGEPRISGVRMMFLRMAEIWHALGGWDEADKRWPAPGEWSVRAGEAAYDGALELDAAVRRSMKKPQRGPDRGSCPFPGPAALE